MYFFTTLGTNCRKYISFTVGSTTCNVLYTLYFLNIGYGRSLCDSDSSKTLDELNETRFRKRPRLGSRYLKEPALVYTFNCWYEAIFLKYEIVKELCKL